jgi:hypothetical protein
MRDSMDKVRFMLCHVQEDHVTQPRFTSDASLKASDAVLSLHHSVAAHTPTLCTHTLTHYYFALCFTLCSPTHYHYYLPPPQDTETKANIHTHTK